MVDDNNIMQALRENWDFDSTVSPGYEYEGAVVQKFPGSVLQVVVRPPQNLWEKFAFNFIRDCRDLPVFNLAFRATFTLIPSAIYMIFFDFYWWWPILHVVTMLTMIQAFHLALHVTAHRPTFKFDIMSHWIPVTLGPVFGQTLYTYYFHHIKMHHVEDNAPSDISATIYFQRDRPLHFLYYFSRFFFLVSIDLSSYFFAHKQIIRGLQCLACEYFSFTVIITCATQFNFWGTFFSLILPFLISRFGMMSGNWVQHAFLDRADPLGGGLYNSITVIESHYNINAFNDGYHASHHLNAKRHWTEHPREFLKKRDEYIKSKAMVLKGVDYDTVWLALMLGRYDWIADWWVHLDPNTPAPTKEELITFLKEKTRRFSKAEVDAAFAAKAAAKGY
ncbi:hypothetical protein HDU97_008709 [Phlyctochytrium planicorne]|nr:hypothetical protein HDU97_008709 [Phlyctochytrium planicorne]